MTPDAAHAEAQRKFGDVETDAALHEHAARVERRRQVSRAIESVVQDVRYAGKGIARQPSVVFGVMLTLAIGIGVNSAIFRLADRVSLGARARRCPGASVDVWRVETLAAPGAETTRTAVFSYPEARTLVDTGAFTPSTVDTPPRFLTASTGRQTAVSIDAAFFRVLGVTAASGRLFDASEGDVGANVPVAVVSQAYWEHELGRAPVSPALVVVTFDRRDYRVIGAAANGFAGIDLDPTEVWLLLGAAVLGCATMNGVVIPWYRSDMTRALRVIGRASPRAASATASQLGGVLGAVDHERGRDPRRLDLTPIVPVGGATVSQAPRGSSAGLSGVAVLVLLIACANAISVARARPAPPARDRDAPRARREPGARIWRLLLIESVVVAIVAGAGRGARRRLGGDRAATVDLAFDARWTLPLVDARTVLFTFTLAVAAGLIAVAWRQPRTPRRRIWLQQIKTGRSSQAKPRARPRAASCSSFRPHSSIVLIVASGLLVESLVRLNAVSLGFEPRDLVTVSLPSNQLTAMPANPVSADTLATRLIAAHQAAEISFASVAPFGRHENERPHRAGHDLYAARFARRTARRTRSRRTSSTSCGCAPHGERMPTVNRNRCPASRFVAVRLGVLMAEEALAARPSPPARASPSD